MQANSKRKASTLGFKKIVSEYAAQKVVDWALKNQENSGAPSSFKWSNTDKVILKNALFKSPSELTDLLERDQKYKIFFESVIDRGLNLDDLHLFQIYKHRLPLRELGLAYNILDFNEAKGKLISKNMISAGYYMFEITISPKAYCSQLPVKLLNMAQTYDLKKDYSMCAQYGKISKRLIKLDDDVLLSLTPASSWTVKDITHFKFAKLTRNFFVSRLYKKIGKSQLLGNRQSVSDDEISQLWPTYQQIMLKTMNSMSLDYHAIIQKNEKSTIPTVSEQIKNLIKWL